MRSKLEPVKKVARTLKAHLVHLLTYFQHPITNALTEGFNSKIQAIKADARGFRRFENYRARILFFCGKLDVLPHVHSAATHTIPSSPKVAPVFAAAVELGALAIDIQLGDYDTPLPKAVALAVHIRTVAHDLNLPFAIETHRDTFTETPEVTQSLCEA